MCYADLRNKKKHASTSRNESQPRGGRHVAHGGLGWQEREDFPGSHTVPAELAPRGRHARIWPVIRRGGRRLRIQALVRSAWLGA